MLMNLIYTEDQQFFSAARKEGGAVSREWLETYQRIRQHSLNLISSMSVEDMAVQSMAECSPVKWHLAQSTWFFEETLLMRFVKNYSPFNPAFNLLFKPGGVNLRRDQRGIMTRPSQALVRSYRTHVDNAVVMLIKDMPNAAIPVLELGLQREQQVQELMLTDIKHLLGSNPFHPTFINNPLMPADKADKLNMLEFKGGMTDIGHPGLTFCFANELPKHRVFLNPFSLADRKVTNGEYLNFMNSDGYADPAWWLEDGLEWRRRERIKAPLYWRKIDGEWKEFTLHGLIPLDLNRPVCHISYYEADAYARFSGARLPTEFEWEFAANSIIPELPDIADWILQTSEQISQQTTMEEMELHPSVANTTRSGSRSGLKQFFTDAWEWTSSCYAPYPGARTKPGSAQELTQEAERPKAGHYVLRGGSVATPPGHSRITYRHFYPAQTRWQFTGIRLARCFSN